MKNLVGKKLNKTTKFVGEEITITKLPLARVFDIQEKAKAAGADEKAQMEIMLFTFQSAVTGAGELTLEDMYSFPLDDLQKLSEEILEFSGLGNAKAAYL